jgi:hypothetical protein
MKFRAKKLIETKMEGEFEIKKSHIKLIELDTEKIENIWEKEQEDYEVAYYNGLGGDIEGELYWVKVNLFLDYCKISAKDEDEIELNIRDYKYFLEKLKNYRDYTLCLINEEVKSK